MLDNKCNGVTLYYEDHGKGVTFSFTLPATSMYSPILTVHYHS